VRVIRPFVCFLAIPRILRILKESNETMAGAIEKRHSWNGRASADRVRVDEWNDPTGMVWCPMKMSGMALLKCAELQKHLGCGSLKQLQAIKTRRPGNVTFLWPWLRRRRECPERASETEVRELRLVLSPLKSAEKSRNNPRAYRCPVCGERKAFTAQRCRRCWRRSVKRKPRSRSSTIPS